MPGKRALSSVAQADEWRKKIQASQLINRLRDHATGKVFMDATQVQAARILLAKVVPDLKAVEHRASDGATLAPAVLIIPAKQNA